VIELSSARFTALIRSVDATRLSKIGKLQTRLRSSFAHGTLPLT